MMPFTIEPSVQNVAFNVAFKGTFNPGAYYDTTFYLQDFLSTPATVISAGINPVLSGNWYAFTIVYPQTCAPHDRGIAVAG